MSLSWREEWPTVAGFYWSRKTNDKSEIKFLLWADMRKARCFQYGTMGVEFYGPVHIDLPPDVCGLSGTGGFQAFLSEMGSYDVVTDIKGAP